MKKTKRIKKRYIILGVVILAILGSILYKKTRPIEYVEYTAKTQTVSDELLLAGTIDAPGRVDLGFAAGGRVDNVYAKAGDSVQKGDVIAEISQNGLLSNLIQARANYTLTQVDTSSNAKTVTQSYESLKEEQDTIVENLYRQYISGDLEARSTDDRDAAKIAPVIGGNYIGEPGNYYIDTYSSAASSGYSYRLSGLESGTYTAFVNQNAPLGTRGLNIQFDEDTRYGNTEWVVEIPNTRSSTYLSRKTAYENAVATRDRILTDALNNKEGVTGEQAGISRVDAQRNQARAQVNAVYTQLNDGKITAPFSGIVAKNDLEVGQIVSAYTPVVVMFENDTKQLDLNVPEIYINKIQEGDNVRIILDAYDDIEFSGTISFIDLIDTKVDGVPVYKTEIIIDDLDNRIRVGMNAKARIIAEEKKDVLAIPKHYIQENEDGTLSVKVKISETDIIEKVVEIGIEGNNGLTEIISGINDGDILVIEDTEN